FYSVAVDTIGPLPTDSQGMKYIITMVDEFTKWVELVAAPSTTAISAADAIFGNIFCRFGAPHQIRSDNGTQYVNKVIKELMKMTGVKHKTTGPYHPQGNGICERINGEVTRILRSLIYEGNSQNEWSRLLPIVMYVLNNRVSRATGYTPYKLIH
ncbi:DDE-type integrase/transposase/recombinase, partial [Aduncisulcus paluster]